MWPSFPSFSAKAKTAARNAAEARARGGLWVKFTSFVTALPRPYIGASILLVLRSLLASLGYKPKGPTVIKIDNTAALRVAEDPVMHDKTKHILRKELKIRELVESGEVKVEYVESLKNFADFFTKPLPRKEFESFRKEIMNDTA